MMLVTIVGKLESVKNGHSDRELIARPEIVNDNVLYSDNSARTLLSLNIFISSVITSN